MHILLVEDNEHDIFFVREALKRLEHRIELSVITDGVQALDFLSRREPYTQARPAPRPVRCCARLPSPVRRPTR